MTAKASRWYWSNMANHHYLPNRLVLLVTAHITVPVFQLLFNILRWHYMGVVTQAGGYDHRKYAT